MPRDIPSVSDYAHHNEMAEQVWWLENRYDMEHYDEPDDEFDPYRYDDEEDE